MDAGWRPGHRIDLGAALAGFPVTPAPREVLMTVDQISGRSQSRPSSTGDMLLDGLFTGMIGALAVAAWFLVLDLTAGRPLYTPALLGSVLLHGTGALAGPVTIAPLEVAAYTAFHAVAFTVVGITFSYLMTLFERFPIMFFVLLVLFLCLMVGFFAYDAALGARLTGQLQAWTVVVANLLASAGMAFYQWKRHPRALARVEKLWEDEDDRR
jgi:hypothetical protein